VPEAVKAPFSAACPLIEVQALNEIANRPNATSMYKRRLFEGKSMFKK